MPIFYTNTGSLGSMQVSGSSIISASAENLVRIIGSGSSILAVSGTRGAILGVSDFNNSTEELLIFSSGSVKILSIDRLKTVSISGSLVVTGSITGSLFGSSSYALTASYALTSAGGSGVGGSGTTNRVAKFTAGTTIGDSRILDDGTNVQITGSTIVLSGSGNVGIGTTAAPAGKLHVNGGILIGTNTDFVLNTAGSGFILNTGASSGNTYSQIYGFQSGNTAYANLVIPGGNFGVSETSPSGKMEVYDAPTFSTIDSFPQFSVKSATGTTGNRLNLGVDQTSGLSFIQSVNRGTGAINLILQRYAGNVGIGGDGVGGFKLHVSGTVNTLNSYYSNGVELITSDGTNNYLKTAATLYIQQGSTTRAVIDGSGNFMVGRTAAITQISFDGASGITYQRSTGDSFAGVLDYLKSRGTSASPTIVQNGDGLFTLRVAPYQGSSYTYLNTMNVDVDGTFTSGQNPPTKISFYTNAANGSSTERVTIKNDGKFGVNSTNPAVQLDVLSDDGVTAGEHPTIARFARNNSAGAIYLGYIANGSALTATQIRTSNGLPISIGTSTATQSLTIVDSGNVGIGTTSPETKLHVGAGNILIDNTNYIASKDTGGTLRTVLYGRFSDNATYLDGGTGGLYLRTNDASVTAMYLSNTGNVGINKTNPSEKLDVNGNVLITGSLRVNTTSDQAIILQTSAPYSSTALTVTSSLDAPYSSSTASGDPLNPILVYLRAFTNTSRNNTAAGIAFGTTSNLGTNNAVATIHVVQPTFNSFASDLAFQTRASSGVTSEKMRLSSNGDLTLGSGSAAVLRVSGSANVTGSASIIGNTVVTGSLVVSGANGAGIFSQGATLVDYGSGISNSGSYMVWRAPFSCSVVALYGYYIGGTSPQINAARSGSSGYGRITGSNLTLTAQNVWSASIASGLQNTAFNAGDTLQVIMSGSANNQLAVQVDFIRRF